MSVQTALDFIRQLRQSEEFREALLDAGDIPGALDDVLQYAHGSGFEFSGEELRRAFELDWRMRWSKYRDEQD
jgi:predicted ribosomally synthesized peptide with nif11-like leader